MSAGSDPCFAGKPGRHNKVTSLQTPKGSTVSSWHACVKNVTVSSREDQAHNLYDGQGHFWQSHGTQGKVNKRKLARFTYFIDYFLLSIHCLLLCHFYFCL